MKTFFNKFFAKQIPVVSACGPPEIKPVRPQSANAKYIPGAYGFEYPAPEGKTPRLETAQTKLKGRVIEL